MDLFKLVFVFIYSHTLQCRPVIYYCFQREDELSTAFKCEESFM